MKQHVAKVALSVFALAGGIVPNASAAISRTHGAAFHAYNASEVTSIDYLTSGARNISGSNRYAIAAVDFVPEFSWSGTGYFWVEGYLASGSIMFTTYAYTGTGTLVKSVNNTHTVSGNFSIPMQMSGMSVDDYVSCLAYMPANSGTLIYGVLSAN